MSSSDYNRYTHTYMYVFYIDIVYIDWSVSPIVLKLLNEILNEIDGRGAVEGRRRPRRARRREWAHGGNLPGG